MLGALMVASFGLLSRLRRRRCLCVWSTTTASTVTIVADVRKIGC
jgi:hypothetical protein